MKKHEMNEGRKIILYTLIVILFLAGMYFFTSFLVKRNKYIKSTKVDNSLVTIQYSEIILGEVFSMSEEEYLVLCFDKNDEKTTLSSLASSLISASKIKLYTVNLASAFNKGLQGDESNKKPEKASDIKINGPTLLHIKNKEVVDYIETEDEIKKFTEQYQ